VILPYEITELDSGSFAAPFDPGEAFDTRECSFEMELNATQQLALDGFLRSTTRGLTTSTITLSPGSGFFPFGPDKGDGGVFTVAFWPAEYQGIGAEPWLYFHTKMQMINVGNWPAYSLPTQVSEGSLAIGTVSACRFPPDFFKPSVNTALDAQDGYAKAISFLDRGFVADTFNTEFVMYANNSKAAALIKYLTGTARGGTFNIVPPNNSYPFECNEGGTATFTVRMAQNELNISRIRHNLFTWSMKLNMVSAA
jgi:hypothetical protein